MPCQEVGASYSSHRAIRTQTHGRRYPRDTMPFQCWGIPCRGSHKLSRSNSYHAECAVPTSIKHRINFTSLSAPPLPLALEDGARPVAAPGLFYCFSGLLAAGDPPVRPPKPTHREEGKELALTPLLYASFDSNLARRWLRSA